MRVVFAHDHRFVPYGGAVYSKSQFPASMWTRYLHAFDEVHALSRLDKSVVRSDAEKLERSSRKNVTFSFVPDLSTPKAQVLNQSKARHVITEAVRGADAVISRLPSEIGLLTIAVAQGLKKPWAVEMAGCPWNNLRNYGTWQGKVYAPVLYWRTKSAVTKAPFALYVTDEFLQRRYPSVQGETVACSDVEISAPSEEVLEKRLERIKSVSAPLTLGLIGTLRGRLKGIQTVLQALAQVRDQLPPVVFRVLGGGDVAAWQAEAAQHGVNDIVWFDGVRPAGELVLAWLDEIDIYLQPSFTEGLPRALVEAMSRGCPAIASACGGIPELLDSDAMIRPGSAHELARLILRATSDKQWQQDQARRNWCVAKKYSRDKLDARRTAFWQRFADYTAATKERGFS